MDRILGYVNELQTSMDVISDSDSDSDGTASEVEDDQINWERRSEMLENVQVRFKTDQQCAGFQEAIQAREIQ
ncbi:hypothetical protein BGZ65_000989 [Modicella reniformis]|uniref:Uncharacterized protein n=1 Tax=Modicella reniformis TaxID=1440133 RepID=A0A9P6SP18_9FUNG|nr:hypothetical protein BGZ65_000989 [Modicella reniformis]